LQQRQELQRWRVEHAATHERVANRGGDDRADVDVVIR
jgi:hypothetical protein